MNDTILIGCAECDKSTIYNEQFMDSKFYWTEIDCSFF